MSAYDTLRAAMDATKMDQVIVMRTDLAELLDEVDKLRAAAKQKKTRKQIAVPAIIVLPDWLPMDAWAAFLDMRKKAKKPATDYAQTLLLKKLAAFHANDFDPGVILNQSIMNGWQDLYAPKDEQRGASMPGGRRVAPVESTAAREERRSRWGLDGVTPSEGVIDAGY